MIYPPSDKIFDIAEFYAFVLKNLAYFYIYNYIPMNNYIPFNVRSTKGLLAFTQDVCCAADIFLFLSQLRANDLERCRQETYVFVMFH